MKEITVTVPDELQAEEARLLLAIKLFEKEKLSLGQAAVMTGYSKRAFMEILGKHGVPVFDYPAEELEGDVRNA